MKLKKDDTVMIIAGNDKGKEGKVKAINKNKIIVQGVNIKKKHQKPSQGQKKGSIVEFEAAIDISNVAYSADGNAVKIRTRKTEDGKKELYYRTKDGTEKAIRNV